MSTLANESLLETFYEESLDELDINELSISLLLNLLTYSGFS